MNDHILELIRQMRVEMEKMTRSMNAADEGLDRALEAMNKITKVLEDNK